MSTALQNIEREKGARQERRAIIAEIRAILELYPKDLILLTLLDKIKDRDAE